MTPCETTANQSQQTERHVGFAADAGHRSLTRSASKRCANNISALCDHARDGIFPDIVSLQSLTSTARFLAFRACPPSQHNPRQDYFLVA